MNYIRLVGILSCLCLLHFGNAAPFISIQSSSRSQSQQMVNGQLRTVYDVSSRNDADDRSGKLIHSRSYDFRSDFAPPESSKSVYIPY